jgi:hypothetical protein
MILSGGIPFLRSFALKLGSKLQNDLIFPAIAENLYLWLRVLRITFGGITLDYEIVTTVIRRGIVAALLSEGGQIIELDPLSQDRIPYLTLITLRQGDDHSIMSSALNAIRRGIMQPIARRLLLLSRIGAPRTQGFVITAASQAI